jgi:hypothetical protein
MSDKPSCFVAYPSKPPSLAETIEQAIETIKQSQVVEIDSWKSTKVSGKFIMTTICKTIDDKDIFLCDLTNLNHNVLFELGFAIAKKKRIWILLDPSIEKSTANYEKFKLLTTVGYSPCSNSHEIVKAFYEEQPYRDLESTIYKDAIESVINPQEKPTLLYLKSGIETEASMKLSRRVDKSQIPSIVDDPNEVRIQTLSWYAQKVYSAYAVIAHFLSLEHAGWILHNAKNSFVSGLAFGFGKPLLMLAHEPYESPIDYRELLKTHRTAAEGERVGSSWLDEVEHKYSQLAVESVKYAEELKASTELQKIAIGDPIAEHESEDLLGYFIRTAAYNEALASKHLIVVGRKGSGKTAILYKLANEITSDTRNHVCIIKPIAYQLEGILRMLQQALAESEKGYLIESFWKFLIYTELAKSVFEALKSKPVYYQSNDDEEELLNFVEENASIITADFSIRLESVVDKLQDVSALKPAAQQRVRISELLHDKVIARLRSILGKVLQKKEKVAILVDNLDKAWKPRTDLSTLCDLLFGLLGVSQRVSQDFQRSNYWRRPVNLSLIIFLRSDIFAQVIKYVPERDKIPYSRIAWDDSQTLLRVLEERFLACSSTLARPSEVWDRYFCPNVKCIPTTEYFTKCILPRPRDLIYLCKTAIAQAVNRRHTRVEEDDILAAQKKYSQYALDSIVVENSIQVETLEELLYEFVGEAEVITREHIREATKVCSMPDSQLDDIIELLCDLTFLGREVESNRFEFQYNDEDKAKLQVMARKTADARADKVERFRINDAFHAYLEIKQI